MAAHVDRDVSELSGGQAKRVALARVLAAPSELLILDEPTNHLDLAGVAWLEEWLAAYPGGLVIVSHDRYLLDRVTTRMLELDRGANFLHEGGYGSYLEARAEREEQAASAEDRRRNLARSELAWLRRGAKARSRKPQARVTAARALIGQRAAEAARPGDLELEMSMARLGDKVIECRGVGVTFGDGRPGAVRRRPPHRAGRPHRRGRAQRQRQVHPPRRAGRRARCRPPAPSRSARPW